MLAPKLGSKSDFRSNAGVNDSVKSESLRYFFLMKLDTPTLNKILDSEQPFGGLMGQTSELKLIQHFVSMPSFNFTQAELADVLGMSRQTISKHLKKLVAIGFLETEKHGRQVLYHLLFRSKMSNIFRSLSGVLIEGLTGIELVKIGAEEPKPIDLKHWQRPDVLPEEISLFAGQLVGAWQPRRRHAMVA